MRVHAKKEQLNILVKSRFKKQLIRLAKRRDHTQTRVIEDLIAQAHLEEFGK